LCRKRASNFFSFPSLSKKIRCRACLAADLNFAYLEMILFRDPASYAEANYNVDNYYGAKIFFHHKTLRIDLVE
jgi:hypothetical protein